MNVPTKNDWSQLAKNTESWIEGTLVQVGADIFLIYGNSEKLKKRIDWSWEVFTDADGQPKAVYWDDATEKEREMLDYFAKYEYAQRNVIEKMKQALALIAECKQIMKEITE